MKPVLQFLKKFSYLAYGAPLLVFLLPFVGQNWSLEVWRFAHKFGLIPLFVLIVVRLKIDSNAKFGFGLIVAFFGSMFLSGMAGRFAYSNRSNSLIAIFDSLTLIALYVILIGYAPRLRKAYDIWKGQGIKKVPFDLSAEAFGLPPQSSESTNYPRA